MKRFGFLEYSFGRLDPAVVALAGALAATLSTCVANAGCGDGACGRVDWTEVTASNPQGTAVSAKLHGAFAWESSPDGWATHPIGGTLSGYVWLSCVPPGDSGPVETTCTDRLASEMAKAGTDTPLMWSGMNNVDPATKQPIVPVGLHAEGDPGAASYLVAFPLGGSPINQAVCPTALAFGRDAGSPDSGTAPDSGSDAAVPTDGMVSGTGSTHGSGSFGPDGGVSAGGTTSSAGGTKAAGGAPRSNMTGTGGRPSTDTGGSTNSTNAAADAGGGCHVSNATSPAGRSGTWMAALVLGLAALRSRTKRRQLP